MTKYNKSYIMRTAWRTVKATGVSISVALRAAWAQEKAEVLAEEIGKESGWNYKVIANNWAKGGHNRTYISTRIYTNRWNLKREIRQGYVDNLTGKFYAA